MHAAHGLCVLSQAMSLIVRARLMRARTAMAGRSVVSAPRAPPRSPACVTVLDSSFKPRFTTLCLAACCWVADCTKIAGYSVEADLNGGAGGLRLASSFAAAATECKADPACAGFNNYAWLLPALAPKQISWGTCLYSRLPTSECRG